MNDKPICKDTRIETVRLNDAAFLHTLMNCPSVLQSLNEVSTEKQDWIDAIKEWNRDKDEEDYIVFHKDIPIGWLGINGLLHDDKTAYLKMAVFLPDYQGQGFGTAAIQALLCSLQDRGIKEILLYTDCDNHRAQACYKKCGFQVIETLSDTMSNGKIVPRYKMRRCFPEKSI